MALHEVEGSSATTGRVSRTVLGRRSLLGAVGAAVVTEGCQATSAQPAMGATPGPGPTAAADVMAEGFAQVSAAESARRGLDLEALRKLREHESTRSDQVTILVDGRLLAHWKLSEHEEPIETMSATKSIVSLAVGVLVDQGKIRSIDQPVSDFFSEYREGPKARVTLRHLLNHTSGIESGKTTEAIYASHDFVRHALDSPLKAEPGAQFFYNNSAVNLLAGVVGRAAGKPLDELARERLFAPLGIECFSWTRDQAGNPHGMSGLKLRSLDLVRVGQMVLDRGSFQGHRVVSEAWIAESTGQAAQPFNPRCALLWWLDIDFMILIDDDLIETLRKGGAPEDFLGRLHTLRGQTFARAEFFPALGRALGGKAGIDEWHANTWKKGLPDGKLVGTRVVGSYADGWLGQRLLVSPEKRLVAARLRFSSLARQQAAQSGPGEKDRFDEQLKAVVASAR